MRRTTIVQAILLAVVILCCGTPDSVRATHLRAAQLTWEATGTTATFEANLSARRDFYNPLPVVGSLITGPDVRFGDGANAVVTFEVETVDAANDVVFAESNFSHTYDSNGPFTATLTDCCRLSQPQHINNPDGNIRTATVVDFAKTSANPVVSIPAIVDCPRDGTCEFNVPASDPDGQSLRFRLASSDEAGPPFVQPGPPQATHAATINAVTGRYSWDTTGATLATSGDTYYSTQVIVENIVSDNVVTSTAADFFIRITAEEANHPPAFDDPTPADDTVIPAVTGTTITFAVKASDLDSGDTVTLELSGKPADATFTVTPGNPATAIFSWTPSAPANAVMNITAEDQHGLQSLPRSIKINVTQANRAPSLTNPGSQTSAEGAVVSLQVSASDLDEDLLSFSASGLPASLSISTAGLIAGTVDYAASAASPYTVTVAVSDNIAAPVNAALTWTVSNTNRAPAFDAPTPSNGTNFTATVAVPVTFAVAAHDPDSSDSITLGLTGQPSGVTFSVTNGNPASATFSWKPSGATSAVLTLTAKDQDGLAATARQVTINVVQATPLESGLHDWGRNKEGQLGDNSTQNRKLPVEPSLLTGLPPIKEMVGGGGHTVALAVDGSVWTWGLNGNGQLGDGTTSNRDEPVQVLAPTGTGVFLTGVRSIGAGGLRSFAIKNDGTLWAWGKNDVGQLGDGSTTSRSRPVQVKGPNGSGFLSNVQRIVGGGFHSLALTGDGKVYTWGFNGDGQLGVGLPRKTTFSNVPLQVTSGASAIAAGSFHSLAVINGNVFGWGRNVESQLGPKARAKQDSPIQIQGLSNITAVAAGRAHSLALKSDHTVLAWGRNNSVGLDPDESDTARFGQLGDGASTASLSTKTKVVRATPGPVLALSGTNPLGNVVQIAAGGYHNLARLNDGTVVAWGGNLEGQLGDDTTTSRSRPVQVKKLTHFIQQVGAGYWQSLALDESDDP